MQIITPLEGRLQIRSVQHMELVTEEEQKSLAEYWKQLEKHVKPQSNHTLNRFYLQWLKQFNN